MQAPKGQLRRQQPEPRPLGPLGLRSQHTPPKSRSLSAAPLLALTIPVPDNSPLPDSTLPQQAALVGVHTGLWPLITGGKSTAFIAGGQEQCLDSFGDTVSHLPDCCSFKRIGVGCGRALSQRLSQRKPLSVFDTCPAKLVIWHPVIPNGS